MPNNLRMLEGKAAEAYLGAWKGYPLPWRKQDLDRLPVLYHTIQGRESPLSGSGYKAVDPCNAMLNFCYKILLGDVREVLVLHGFEPDVGLLHADQPDALVYDVMEPLRGHVDDRFLRLLRRVTLRYGDANPILNGSQYPDEPDDVPSGTTGWVMRPEHDGLCRLHPEFQRCLATCCRIPHREIVALVGTLKHRLLTGEV